MRNLQKTSLKNLKHVYLIILLNLSLYVFVCPQNTKSMESKPDVTFFSQPLINCWSYKTRNIADFSFASDNANELYIPLLDGKLISLNSQIGKVNWENDLGGEIVSKPLLENRSLYVAVNNKAVRVNGAAQRKITIRSLDKLTGVTIWETYLPDKMLENAAVNEKLYLYSYKDFLIVIESNGNQFSIEKNSGRVVSNKYGKINLTAVPFFSGDKILLSASDKILVLNPSSLTLSSNTNFEQINLKSSPTAIIYLKNDAGNIVFWGDKKGYINSFDLNLKKHVWKFRIGAEVSNIDLTDAGLLVTSLDNFIYMFSEKNGDLRWKKRLNSRISAKPLIKGKYAVVTAIAELTAVVIDLENGKTVNNITLTSDNFFIGEGVGIQNQLIYSTAEGIYSFSQKEFCR